MRMTLTPPEIQLFRHNGFVKFPTSLPQAQVAALKEAALKDIRDAVEPVARQNDRVIRVSNLWGRGGIFRETIGCDEIRNPLSSLLGPNIDFVLNRHNHVYLRDRESTASLELHRDVMHWSRTIVTVLVWTISSFSGHGCESRCDN